MSDIIASHEKDGWDQGRVFVAGVDGRIGIRTGGPNGSGLIIDDWETARAIAHAILDADRHDLEAKPLARVEIIDVAAHAAEHYGSREKASYVAGRQLPEHEYRFRGNDPARNGESQPTYGVGYTAAHVMASIERDRELEIPEN